jgi:anti-anti-sigma factor
MLESNAVEGAAFQESASMADSTATSVEQTPQAVIVHVGVPNLGSSEVNAVCSGIDEARKTAPTLPFILDLAKVVYVPSVGLGVLVGLNQEFRTRGQRLILVNLQINVRQSINITNLSRALEILPDIPSALKSLDGKA